MKVISLGCNCDVTYFFGRNMAETYPFDWIWSTLDFVYSTFASDHFIFTECEKLNAVWHPPFPHTYIHNHKNPRECTAVSLHDADQHTPEQSAAEIPEINAKYERRFERLYATLCSTPPTEPIYLVRKVLNNDQRAVRNEPDTPAKLNALAALLLTKFPTTQWQLCVVNAERTLDLKNAEPWHDRIRHFYSFQELDDYMTSQGH